MACCTHMCLDCDHEYFNNSMSLPCPMCGSHRKITTFDEQEWEVDDDYDEEEQESE